MNSWQKKPRQQNLDHRESPNKWNRTIKGLWNNWSILESRDDGNVKKSPSKAFRGSCVWWLVKGQGNPAPPGQALANQGGPMIIPCRISWLRFMTVLSGATLGMNYDYLWVMTILESERAHRRFVPRIWFPMLFRFGTGLLSITLYSLKLERLSPMSDAYSILSQQVGSIGVWASPIVRGRCIHPT